MHDHDFSPSANQMVSDARQRVEMWRAELRDRLSAAKQRYRLLLSNLEAATSTLSQGAGGSLASRLETMRGARGLQQAASDFDTGIARIAQALEHLDNAAAVLDGKISQPAPDERSSEISPESVAIQAQEEERYRLAREIHDGPAQILANVALQLEYISKLAVKEPVRARDELTNIQKDLRLAVGEVRRFMYDLRPPALAQQGVGPAVESHCQRLAERFGMKIGVQWQATSTMHPSHDTAVFRIVQEALQNIVKHAQATQVEVRAVDRDGYLEVSVADNGKGFDAEQVRRLDPKHFGLAGMRARAQQIGASLDLASAPDQGTTIILRVPVM